MEVIYWLAAVLVLGLGYWLNTKREWYYQRISLLEESLEVKVVELAEANSQLKKIERCFSQIELNLRRAIQTTTFSDEKELADNPFSRSHPKKVDDIIDAISSSNLEWASKYELQIKENKVLKEELAEVQLKLNSFDLTTRLESIKNYSEHREENNSDPDRAVYSLLCDSFLGPEAVNYDNNALDYPLQKDVCNGHDVFFLHEYYPKNRLPVLPDAFENKRRRIISFKDCNRTQIDYYAKEVANNLQKAFKEGVFKREINDLVAIIPSSSDLMTITTFYSFCDHVSIQAQLVNGFNVIDWGEVPKDRIGRLKHDPKTKYFKFNPEKVRGNTVYLIDVNITSGRTFKFCSDQLMALGAKNVVGIFLSKSVDWYGRVRWLEPAWP